jgi:hypothetical protein
MEQKLCKKCSSELPEDHKGARCDAYKAERMRRIRKIGLTVGAALFVAVAVFSVNRTESDDDDDDDENDELSRSDSSRAEEMGISLTDYLILSEGIEDGKLSISWANYNLDAIKDGLLSAREVVNSGSPDDDD